MYLSFKKYKNDYHVRQKCEGRARALESQNDNPQKDATIVIAKRTV